MDRQVKALLQSCYESAVKLLTDNRSLLDDVAQYLLVKETISGDELMAYIRADQEKKEIPE